MTDDIIFETEDGYESIPTPTVEPSGIIPYLQKKGFAHSREEAFTIIIIVLLVLLGGSFFIFKKTLPEAPVLGEDRLRPGEVIPDYVK